MQPGAGELPSIPAPSLRAADNRQARKASMISALELTRRETLLLGAAAFTSSMACNVEAAQDSERHGVSVFGDLKYPPDFKHFRLCQSKRPEGGHLFTCRCDSDFQSESTHLQFAQQLHPQGRCRHGDGAHLRELDGARRG